jgi:peroxiredoxin
MCCVLQACRSGIRENSATRVPTRSSSFPATALQRIVGRVGRVFTRPTATATSVGLVKTRPTLPLGDRNAGRSPTLRGVIQAVVLCAMFAGIATLPPADAAAQSKFNKVVEIGAKAPEWSDLPSVDGKSHSLSEFRDAKAVVLVFTCNHCPVAKQYEERLIQFAKAHEKQVQVVAISVSHNAADRLDKMKSRAAEKRFPFPYLYDESQQSARAYGATVTPHFFVLDADRKIAYMGAFDDNIFEPEKVEKHYLVDAVEAVLAGNEPKVKESLQRGCAIDYE